MVPFIVPKFSKKSLLLEVVFGAMVRLDLELEVITETVSFCKIMSLLLVILPQSLIISSKYRVTCSTESM